MLLRMIDAIEAERSHPSDRLPALLLQGEKVLKTCVPRVEGTTLSDGPTVAILGPQAVQQLRLVVSSAHECHIPS
jgi:hypothetical protein